MKVKSNHIIHRVLVNVKNPDTKASFQLKDRVEDLIKMELMPIIEGYLDHLDLMGKHEHFQISKLEFDLKGQQEIFIGAKGIKERLATDQLLRQVKEQLEQQLQLVKYQIESEHLWTDQDKRKNTHFINKNFHEDEGEKELIGLTALEREVKTIFFVLEKGYLPWWIGENESINFFSNWSSITEIEEILGNQIFRSSFISSCNNKVFRTRFMNQFSHQQQVLIFQRIIQDQYGVSVSHQLKALLSELDNMHIKNSLWDFIWSFFFDEGFFKNQKETEAPARQLELAWKNGNEKPKKAFREEIVFLKRKISPDNKLTDSRFIEYLFPSGKSSKSSISSPEQTVEPPEKKQQQGESELNPSEILEDSGSFHVGQAGLILLHPFLREFFLNTEVINAKNEFSDSALAVCLLHYLATKEEQAFDHQLIFEKFCCNMAPDAILNRDIKLTEKHKYLAQELLQSVIGHWTALKGTGIDTLRAEFLSRRGKLIIGENRPKLIFERKPQDILLEKIPWNISMVKLPWQKKLLFVEW